MDYCGWTAAMSRNRVLQLSVKPGSLVVIITRDLIMLAIISIVVLTAVASTSSALDLGEKQVRA